MTHKVSKKLYHVGEKEKWIAAMDEEIDSLIKNKTWILVDEPKQ